MSAPASYGMPPPGIIPALSIRAPWTIALAHLGKRIENRLAWRACKYRGPLILHAAAWPSGDAARFEKKPSRSMLECYETALEMTEMTTKSGYKGFDGRLTMREILALRGGAFAFSSIVDVVDGPIDFDMKVKAGKIPEAQRAWYMGGFALVLGAVKLFGAPGLPALIVPCAGALGLFGLHKDAYDLVMAWRAT